MILAIRTDQPEAELCLMSDDGAIVRDKKWLAGRELARNLLVEIEQLLDNDLNKINSLVVYQGPGSFTGLRIGITVANALSYSLGIKIVGTSGPNWRSDGLQKLREKTAMKLAKPEKATAENGVVFAEKSALERAAQLEIVTPNYGAAAHITAPKK